MVSPEAREVRRALGLPLEGEIPDPLQEEKKKERMKRGKRLRLPRFPVRGLTLRQWKEALALSVNVEKGTSIRGSDLDVETTVSLWKTDGRVFKKAEKTLICRYCRKPITSKNIQHVEKCRKNYENLQSHGLWELFSAPKQLAGVSIENGKPRCEVCGMQVEDERHFQNGGKLECRVFRELTENVTVFRDALRNGWKYTESNSKLRFSPR